MNTKKTTFQKVDGRKSFSERSVGDKSLSKRPHFSEKKQDKKVFDSEKSSDNRKRFSQKIASTPTQTLQVTETVMGNAKGTGNVKVVVKRTEQDKSYTKKTGPLSPRAPEKIKKNRAEEMKIYGESTCLTVFKKRPESIVRVWATVNMAHRIGDMFSYLASEKKAYHVVDLQELNLVSGTEHHGGICMLVKKSRPFTLEGYLTISREKNCLVVLDGIRNPHNIGGIVKTCAFYGINGIITDDTELFNSSSAMRIAEGGSEYVHSLQTNDLTDTLVKLRTLGYQIIHLTNDKNAPTLASLSLSTKVAFVLSESSTEHLIGKNDDVVSLSYVNPLNTRLNVAVATGILLSKWA